MLFAKNDGPVSHFYRMQSPLLPAEGVILDFSWEKRTQILSHWHFFVLKQSVLLLLLVFLFFGDYTQLFITLLKCSLMLFLFNFTQINHGLTQES